MPPESYSNLSKSPHNPTNLNEEKEKEPEKENDKEIKETEEKKQKLKSVNSFIERNYHKENIKKADKERKQKELI